MVSPQDSLEVVEEAIAKAWQEAMTDGVVLLRVVALELEAIRLRLVGTVALLDPHFTHSRSSSASKKGGEK